jgi:flagella basal body P-ring formation protein FlgA
MIRTFGLLFLAIAMAFMAIRVAAAQPSVPVELRAEVTVDERLIRLGDIFQGVVESADTPVAKAPEAGESLVLDARWLAAAARAFKLSWQPATRFEQVVVTRASRRFGAEAVKDAVSVAIADAGAVDDIAAVEFQFDPLPMELVVPTDVEASLGVRDLLVDERSGRFSATVVAPAEGPVSAQTSVSGRLLELIEVPVLTARVLPGEVIQAEDVEWARSRLDRVSGSVVLDPSQIVGKTPRRPLRAGEPIRNNDLETALTIRKGSLVTMVLQSPQMVLTVSGRALEDGAEGQLIQVANAKSDRIVHAVVQDANTVTVTLQ